MSILDLDAKSERFEFFDHIVKEAIVLFLKKELTGTIFEHRIKFGQTLEHFPQYKWEDIANNLDKYYLFAWPNFMGYEVHIGKISEQFKRKDWGFHLWVDTNNNYVTIKKILSYYEEFSKNN